MPDDIPSPLVAHARSQSIGNLARRSAARDPDKTHRHRCRGVRDRLDEPGIELGVILARDGLAFTLAALAARSDRVSPSSLLGLRGGRSASRDGRGRATRPWTCRPGATLFLPFLTAVADLRDGVGRDPA